MIYLIGGASRVGKPTLAHQISANLGAGWISTDALLTMLPAKQVAGMTLARFDELPGHSLGYANLPEETRHRFAMDVPRWSEFIRQEAEKWVMGGITFECSRVLPQSAADLCTQIADVARWQEFNGYGILPGIEQADYEVRTADMAGSRVRVRNTDGSGHVEEILVWDNGRHIVMKLHDFTAPLSRLASHFVEEWRFESVDQGTRVTRSFQLYPMNALTLPILWLISRMFRQAIARHLAEMDPS